MAFIQVNEGGKFNVGLTAVRNMCRCPTCSAAFSPKARLTWLLCQCFQRSCTQGWGQGRESMVARRCRPPRRLSWPRISADPPGQPPRRPSSPTGRRRRAPWRPRERLSPTLTPCPFPSIQGKRRRLIARKGSWFGMRFESWCNFAVSRAQVRGKG